MCVRECVATCVCADVGSTEWSPISGIEERLSFVM